MLHLNIGLPAENAEGFKAELVEHSPRIDEDTMPGELANVVQRVANLLNLQGPNYTTDAACASSMAAIGMHVGFCKIARLTQLIAGASDRTMDPATLLNSVLLGLYRLVTQHLGRAGTVS